jgi:hypothetical protein
LKQQIRNILKKFPDLDEVVFINNIVKGNVYGKYFPGYENRINMLNEIYCCSNFSVRSTALSLYDREDLMPDGIHFKEAVHRKIYCYIEGRVVELRSNY